MFYICKHNIMEHDQITASLGTDVKPLAFPTSNAHSKTWIEHKIIHTLITKSRQCSFQCCGQTYYTIFYRAVGWPPVHAKASNIARNNNHIPVTPWVQWLHRKTSSESPYISNTFQLHTIQESNRFLGNIYQFHKMHLPKMHLSFDFFSHAKWYKRYGSKVWPFHSQIQ